MLKAIMGLDVAYLKGRKKIIKLACIALIFVTALSLRLYHIDSFSFWYDEASQVLDNRSILDIPPVYKFYDSAFTVRNQDYLNLYNHFVVYYWRKIFGLSERNSRSSSVICSLLSIILAFVIARKYFSEKSAYITAVLLSLAPFNIYYSQELRPYAAIGFISLVVIYSLINYLNRGKSLYLCLYIVSSVINIYALFTTFALTCAIIAYLFINFKKYKRFLPRLTLAHGFILALIFPASIIIVKHLKLFLSCSLDNFRIIEYPVWLEKVTATHILNTFINMSIGYNLDYGSLAGKIVTILYFFLFCFGIYKYGAKAETRILAACFLIPILMVFIMSQIKPCYVDRYFFPQSIIYIIFVSAGLSKVKRWPLIVIMGAIVSINILALKNYYNNTYPVPAVVNSRFGVGEKIDIRPLVSYLAENYNRGDKMLNTWKGNVFPIRYYMPLITTDKFILAECNKGVVIDYDQKNNVFMKIEYSDLHPYVNKMERFDIKPDDAELDGVWVIKFTDNNKLIEYFKNSGYKIKDYKIFNRNNLFYFSRIKRKP